MTDQTIEQIAREIAAKAVGGTLEGKVFAEQLLAGEADGSYSFKAARLALLEGERRERERCAALVEELLGCKNHILDAIRSAIP